MSTSHHTHRPSVVAVDSGTHYHFLNHLATVKVVPDGDGSMSVVEFHAPRGFGPPLHRHESEDELFIILDGEIEVRSGDDAAIAAAGAYVYLPRRIPHTFQVHSATARIATITAAGPTVPRFDAMVAALGTPVDEPTMPVPVYIDPSRVADVTRDHGIDILGPPLPPLPPLDRSRPAPTEQP
jgi:quercetin dioxygenase-like cupin family protein